METLLANAAFGPARRVREGGRDYLVAPLTSIVPGVLPGSKGPLLYRPDVVSKRTADWDGMPLTNGHPYDPITNEPMSASDAGVLDRQGIGEVRNSTFAGKLRHEAWFDVAKTRNADARFGTDVYDRLTRGTPTETSTGLFTKERAALPGAAHNGRSYTHEVEDYRPDHMAVLPNAVGACSINDGCGVLVNQRGQGMSVTQPLQPLKSPGLFERFLNWFAVHNAEQPRHPRTAQFQGLTGTAARRGFSAETGPAQVGHGDPPSTRKQAFESADSELDEQDAPAELVGKDNSAGDDGRGLDTLDHEAGDEWWGRPDDHQNPKQGPDELKADAAAKLGLKHPTVVNEQLLDFVEMTYNRDWPQAKRDQAPEGDFAGPGRSFPIVSQTDVDAAAHLVGKAANPAAVKAKIKHIAKVKSLSLPTAWQNEAPTKNDGRSPATNDCGTKPMTNYGGSEMGGYGEMTPHAASKQAAGASLMSEHEPAMEQAGAALAASKAGNAKKAGSAHGKAAEAHEQQSVALRKKGDAGGADEQDAAAALHRKAAGMHAATMNSNPEGHNQYTGGGGGGGKSGNNLNKGDKVRLLKSVHSELKKEDKGVSATGTITGRAGDQVHVKHDSGHSSWQHHNNLTKNESPATEGSTMKFLEGLTANQRVEKLKELRPKMLAKVTANCTCETEKKGFGMLNNETLLTIITNNEKAEGSNADVSGARGATEQVGGEEGPDTDGDEDSDFASKKGKGLEGGFQPKDKGMMSQNAMKAWMDAMPEEARGTWNAAVEIERNAKTQLVERLVANVANVESRKALVADFMRKDLPTLRQLVQILPTPTQNYQPQSRREQPDPLIFPTSGDAVTANADQDRESDILQLPSITQNEYKEISNSRLTGDARRQATA